MPARGPPRPRQANPQGALRRAAAAARHPGQGRPAPRTAARGRHRPRPAAARRDAVGRGGRRRASGRAPRAPLTPTLASPQSGVALLPPPPGIDAGTWSAALAAAWGSRPPWSPSTPGGADGVSTDVVALGSAALLTPAKDDDEPDADDDDAWESVPAPGDDDGGDGATKEEAKDGDDAKAKDGDKEEKVEDKEEKAKVDDKEEKAKDDDKENEAKAGENAKDDDKENEAKAGEKAKVDDEEKDEKAGDKAKAATPAPETPAKDAHLASRLFDEPSPTSSHASSAKESLASFGDEGSLSGDDVSFGEPDRRVVVEGAMVVASDRDDAIASRWVVLRGDALELYKEPPHRSKVASHDASHGTALFGAAHVDTDECLDSALASASVAGCAVDFAAAFVDDAAATRSDPCRYDADRVFRGDGTGSKTFSQDALPSAVGAFKVLATRTRSARDARDGSALCALLRHLNLPAMNNDASVVDNDPKSTEQAIANFALALGALRKSGKLDNGFYADAGFSTARALYGALSRDVAAKSNERSVALGAVFKAHVAKKLRLGARVLGGSTRSSGYDLGLAKFLGPAYAARETDAFSKHVALAFADGARLKTLLYHFVGDAGPRGRAGRARARAAFGRAAADGPGRRRRGRRALRGPRRGARRRRVRGGARRRRRRRALSAPALFGSGRASPTR
ncbi:hypothetical protein SO694_000114109 [Aureococcus anophagefferens]|uniref:Uncharacterized protein n=1 Tax=Aureococcus anophagefferens TaxID=44056 RepID=A0ABR1GFF7_AURAN